MFVGHQKVWDEPMQLSFLIIDTWYINIYVVPSFKLLFIHFQFFRYEFSDAHPAYDIVMKLQPSYQEKIGTGLDYKH